MTQTFDPSAGLIGVHTLPATTGVDGLLGLDFFDGRQLHIDFRNTTITLE